jgi:hypothetical protein
MVLMVLIAGSLTPEYSHVSQYISELGARGARHEWGVRFFGFLPAGVLLIGFCFFAYKALPRSRVAALGLLGLGVFAVGYLVAAAFPCDPGCRPRVPSTSQIIHNAGGLVGYLLALVGYGAAGLALLGMLTLSPGSPVAGLSQRLLEMSVLGWAALCGIYLVRRSGASRLS